MKDIFNSTHELCEEYRTLLNRPFKSDDYDDRVKESNARNNLLGRKEVFMAWIKMCESTQDNDKTSPYEYDNGTFSMNNKGELPEGTGERWLTPSEIAYNHIKAIDKSIKEIEETLK